MSDSSAISPTAVVSPKAQLGHGVQIGHCSIVYDNVEIGDNTRVDDFCVIGQPATADLPPLVLGAGSRVRSHSVIYEGSEIGPRLETGHYVLIRAGAHIGLNMRIGTYSSLEGAMQIGDFARLQGSVQVGPGTTLGHFVSIFSLVTATNDPLPPSHVFRPVTVADGAVVAVGVTLMPGVNVGAGSFIAAGARPTGDIPAGVFVDASGKIAGPVTRLIDLESATRHPWMGHFADAYPDDAQERIRELNDRVVESAKEWRRQNVRA